MRCAVTASFWLASGQITRELKIRRNILKIDSLKTSESLYIFKDRYLSCTSAEPHNLLKTWDCCRWRQVTVCLLTNQNEALSLHRQYKLMYNKCFTKKFRKWKLSFLPKTWNWLHLINQHVLHIVCTPNDILTTVDRLTSHNLHFRKIYHLHFRNK